LEEPNYLNWRKKGRNFLKIPGKVGRFFQKEPLGEKGIIKLKEQVKEGAY